MLSDVFVIYGKKYDVLVLMVNINVGRFVQLFKEHGEQKSMNPFVFWRRVKRTNLYAVPGHFIIYNFFFLQAYFLHISLKADLSK